MKFYELARSILGRSATALIGLQYGGPRRVNSWTSSTLMSCFTYYMKLPFIRGLVRCARLAHS